MNMILIRIHTLVRGIRERSCALVIESQNGWVHAHARSPRHTLRTCSVQREVQATKDSPSARVLSSHRIMACLAQPFTYAAFFLLLFTLSIFPTKFSSSLFFVCVLKKTILLCTITCTECE